MGKGQPGYRKVRRAIENVLLEKYVLLIRIVERPDTAVEIAATFDGAVRTQAAFVRCMSKDEWGDDLGVYIAIDKAISMLAKRIVSEMEQDKKMRKRVLKRLGFKKQWPI